jgi:hypothetical protein
VSRRHAVAALRGTPEPGLATGVSWLSADLRAEARGGIGLEGVTSDRAEIAAALEVDLVFVAADESDSAAGVESLHDADVAAVWTVEGVFGRVARAIGWVEALRMTAADPGALALRLDAALHEALVDARAGVAAGADALLVGDDIAGPAGPLLSPDYVLDALLPCYHRIVLEARAADLPALFHSDGEIRAFIPALARAGFTGVHLAGLEPLAFSANGTAARSVGLVVLGGISAAALPRGARDEGERAAAFAHSLGCAIVCDDGGITLSEQVAALGAALTAARDAYRRLGG